MAEMMTYDGSTSWAEYEAHVGVYCDLYDLPKRERVRYLNPNLRGEAQAVLLNLTEEQREDYSEVAAALEQAFCPTEKVHAYLAELQARRQMDDGALAALARDIQQKTRLAYPEAPKKMMERMVTGYFVGALKDR